MFLMFTEQRRLLHLTAMVVFLPIGGAWEDGNTVSPETRSATQIVEQMQRQNQVRREHLKHYQALRHYEVEYRGYFRRVAATMDVEVSYDASSGKAFRIVSQSGSRLLREKVLKRAVESELEASENKSETVVSEANYKFRLEGTENLNGRPAYILDVQPLHKSRFLFQGKIWVDSADYALAKIEAEPVKNPSFWISKTRVVHTNAERSGFWLPEHSRSESKVRVGGTAVLNIDYGTYQIVPENSQPAVAR